MKKLLGTVTVSLGLLAFGATANATAFNLDFEDGINQGSSTDLGNAALQTYLENKLGRTNVDAGDTRYFASSNTFGSDAIFSQGSTSTIDFDTDFYTTNDWYLTKIKFDWAVLDTTGGIDFGLDVYSDHDTNWHSNYFTVSTNTQPDTGNSGWLVFDPTWEVTRIRFHDSGTYDVGMDNLMVYDNHNSAAVPEPATLAMFGLGLAGLGALRRRRRQS